MVRSGIYTGLLGALVAAALFASIFWALARFMPAFLAFADSRWAHLLPILAVVVLVMLGLQRLRSKRRAV
jgi:cell division protein FtsX